MMRMMRMTRTTSVIRFALLLCWIGSSHSQFNTTEPTMSPTMFNMTSSNSTSTSVPTSTLPTSMPTSLATMIPTIIPTAFPTTLAPTNATITETPTLSPTTIAPTTSPTAMNTSEPTITPTTTPTIAPTNSIVATSSPTVLNITTSAPSMAPVTTMPTNAPTYTLTESPTMGPTMAPQTEMPTRDDSTSSPTTTPTMMPTTETPRPTSSTDSPTDSPTVGPTITGDRVSQLFPGIALKLNGMGTLNAGAQGVFVETLREEYISGYSGSQRARYLRSLQFVDGVDNFQTQITWVDQTPREDGNTVIYDQRVSYVSTTTAEASSVVLGPFNDPNFRARLVNRLKLRDSSFARLESVERPDLEGDRSIEDDDDDGLSAGAIAGIAIGGVALLAIIAFVAMRMSKNNEGHHPINGNEPPASFSAIQSEEVSTMEDPNVKSAGTAGSGSLLDVGDQSVATVDYDYSKAYGGADNSVVSSAGGTMGENTRETGSALQVSARAALGASFDSEGKPDANVREEVIEINAPAGKLGVVIDTPDEGAPVVHAVKDSSVIADLIQVGDKLVAVDDEDVTAMTAIKVSKLISKKSANPSRKLTVIRQVVVED